MQAICLVFLITGTAFISTEARIFNNRRPGNLVNVRHCMDYMKIVFGPNSVCFSSCYGLLSGLLDSDVGLFNHFHPKIIPLLGGCDLDLSRGYVTTKQMNSDITETGENETPQVTSDMTEIVDNASSSPSPNPSSISTSPSPPSMSTPPSNRNTAGPSVFDAIPGEQLCPKCHTFQPATKEGCTFHCETRCNWTYEEK